jgi:putative ABC transport system permease protein
MKFWAPVLTGVSELLAHKLRSLLTMLGVIFGIASVISMVSIGAGAKQETLEQIRLMGVNVIQINRMTLSGEPALEAQRDSPNGLTYGDAQAIKQLYPGARRVVPVCQVFGEVRAEEKTIVAKVFGTTPDYCSASRQQVSAGRFLDEHDLSSNSPVCVIGGEIRRNAFPFDNPLGKTLRIGPQQFTVVGVMEQRALAPGSRMVAANDPSQDIYIPLSVAMDEFKIYVEQALPADLSRFILILNNLARRPPLQDRSITQVIIQVKDETETLEAARVAKRILERRHKAIADYDIVIPSELLHQSQQAQRTFNIVMGAIASISLFVGGIGIMNIMLATVTARSREIGIRRCIGASRADIARQFLLECLVITSSGGLLGIALGVELARLISQYSHWRTIVSGDAILLSLLVAVVTGIVFGLYPAVRAAAVEPMEALRAE